MALAKSEYTNIKLPIKTPFIPGVNPVRKGKTGYRTTDINKPPSNSIDRIAPFTLILTKNIIANKMDNIAFLPWHNGAIFPVNYSFGLLNLRMEENDTDETDEFMEKIKEVKLTEELVTFTEHLGLTRTMQGVKAAFFNN